jgi:NIMA (never in mitosis gene a)-related kinase
MVYGIKELHDRNIIHRDLKSANIFLMKDGICKLGDLNVSKVAKTGLLKTQTGTPYFASPEVWSGKEYGLKSDIWSLGCILYQMATLKMPFQGNNFKEVYNNVSKCKYQPLPNIYSKELDSIIKKLLQIDPEKRPTCQEILKDPIIIEKSKYFFNINLNKAFNDAENNGNNKNDDNNDNKKENNSNKIKSDNKDNSSKKIKSDIDRNSKISKNENRLLKTVKYNQNKDINELLPKNKGYKLYNNYRIFKNYDTNPSSTAKDEKAKEQDDKLNNDNTNIGCNKKFYNKSNINKYKTINSNFLKSKAKINNLEDKSDSMNKNDNSTEKNNKTMNKQNSVPYINHRSEGNSSNK